MSDQITASHILIGHAEASNSSSSLSREDALAQIESIKSEIEGGASFADPPESGLPGLGSMLSLRN